MFGAGAAGSSITQPASHEDWGAQSFATGGWDAPENYTGHAHGLLVRWLYM